ncbi:hypothetical protein MMC28_007114 [Mycoblastus sanguinarius]|nr:hypothetical protein [Mycoblastus sanguinarius]
MFKAFSRMTPWRAALTNALDPQMLSLLLERGANIEENTFDRNTALCVAVESDNLAIARFLLEKGASHEVEVWKYSWQKISEPLLLVAVRREKTSMVKLLLENGADVEKRNNSETALHVAVRNHHESITTVQLLLHHGANIKARLDEIGRWGETVLRSAVRGNNPAMVEMMLNSGIEVDAKNY